ncbi:hypothetical protein KIH81_00475 [Bifidobacterium sp. 82T25]|nr:hypothetical protein [Bifidobacterium miconisargentati]
MCDECVYWCNRCDHALCDECSYWCADCDDRICTECAERCEECDDRFCPSCFEEHECVDIRMAAYTNPYQGRPVREPFTFGLEIEVGGWHDTERMKDSSLIAGWCTDGSLHHDGALEYQTQPMTMDDLPSIVRLVSGIDPDNDNSQAGGHMHVSRTPKQTPSRWYWALTALDKEQCEKLNMRHMTNSRWCELTHGHYNGKATAINDQHAATIEFRTFGPWWKDTANRLAPAVNYMHTMWRFFQRHPLYSLKRDDIIRMSRTACRNAIPAKHEEVNA